MYSPLKFPLFGDFVSDFGNMSSISGTCPISGVFSDFGNFLSDFESTFLTLGVYFRLRDLVRFREYASDCCFFYCCSCCCLFFCCFCCRFFFWCSSCCFFNYCSCCCFFYCYFCCCFHLCCPFCCFF